MDQITHQNKIMIVEDDEQISQLLIFLLQRDGFSTEYAADGRAALEIIEHNSPPALILLDVMLPYLDGYQLLSKIRMQAMWEEIPVIMLTSKSKESGIVSALNAGADDYVVKPFHPGELMARIRNLLLISSKHNG